MFEYTVDWAINVSLNSTNSFFSSLFRRSHFLVREPRGSRATHKTTEELSEAFDWYLSG